jgi:hypothetical protein
MLDQDHFEKFLLEGTVYPCKKLSNSLSIDKLKLWAEKQTRKEIVQLKYFYILIRLIENNLVNIFEEDVIPSEQTMTIDTESEGEDFDDTSEDEEIDLDVHNPKLQNNTSPKSETMLQYLIRFSNGYINNSVTTKYQELAQTLMHYDNTHTMHTFIGANSIIADVALKYYANRMDLMQMEIDTKTSHIEDLREQMETLRNRRQN